MASTLSSSTAERRRWQRIPVAIPIFVRGADSDGAPFLEFTTALNISAGGALVILRHADVPAHAPLSIEIPAAPLPESSRSRRNLDGHLIRMKNILGWCVGALEFNRPLLGKDQGELKK